MCLIFGLENTFDWLSSVIILWRFWASGEMTKDRERTLKRREVRASMAISMMLMVLGVAIVGTSSYDMNIGPGIGHESDIVFFMAGTSIFVFGSLSIVKFQYASGMGSEALYKDGVCSLIGTILASSIFTNTLLIRKRPDIWWLDSCAGMICGFAALFIGFHTIFVAWKRRVPILSLSWWMMSRGDGKRYNRRPPPPPPRRESLDNEVEDDGNESDSERYRDDYTGIEMKKGSTNLVHEIV